MQPGFTESVLVVRLLWKSPRCVKATLKKFVSVADRGQRNGGLQAMLYLWIMIILNAYDETSHQGAVITDQNYQIVGQKELSG